MDKTIIGFIIPLLPSHKSNNWGEVCNSLNKTLQYLLNKNNKNYKVYVVCTDFPTNRIFERKIEWLQIPYPFQEFHEIPEKDRLIIDFKTDKMVVRRWDKARKVTYGSSIALTQGCSYIMSLDADDLLSKGFVDYIYNNHLGESVPGWVLDKGFVYKKGQKFLLKVPSNFFKFNGSTAILHKSLITIPSFVSTNYLDYNLFTDHGWIFDRLHLEKGVLLKKLSLPFVIYVVHENNASDINRLVFGYSFKKLIKRLLYLRRITKKIKSDFSISN